MNLNGEVNPSPILLGEDGKLHLQNYQKTAKNFGEIVALISYTVLSYNSMKKKKKKTQEEEDVMDEEAEKLARELKNAYHRRWAEKNRDRYREYQRKYWKKKAEEAARKAAPQKQEGETEAEV